MNLKKKQDDDDDDSRGPGEKNGSEHRRTSSHTREMKVRTQCRGLREDEENAHKELASREELPEHVAPI